MADKTYVCVAPVSIREAFDNKFKSAATKLVNAALTKLIDGSSKLTTKPPADKNAEGFYLDGSLGLTKSDKEVEADIKMAMADWPKKSIFAVANSSASLEVDDPAKIDEDDVEAVIQGVIDEIESKVLKEFEKRAK
jgi:hypothetical protein